MYPVLARTRKVDAEKMISSLAHEMSQMRPDQPEFSACEAVSDGLMKSIISIANLKTANDPWNTAVETGLRLIKLCCSIGCQAHITLVLDRILLPKADCDVRNQIEKGLIPVLLQLRKTVLPQSQIYSDEPYSSFAAKAIKVYIKAVLGQKPVETVSVTQIGTVGCNQCEDCRHMRQFFLGEGPEVKVLSITKVQIVRAHLEKELAKTLAWGVTWTTNRSGSPHTLQITKPDTLVATTAWARKQAVGLELARSLGDEATLQKIFGAEFWTVANALGLRTTVPQAVGPATAPATRDRLQYRMPKGCLLDHRASLIVFLLQRSGPPLTEIRRRNARSWMPMSSI